MSFDTNLDESQQVSTPELYVFTSGSTAERITSYKTALTFMGNKFYAKPIKRGGFSYDRDFGSTIVRVQVLLTEKLKKYIANNPIEPTQLKIYRTISTDLTDFKPLFDGQVRNVVIRQNKVQLECATRRRYLKKKLPGIINQADCNHALFDAGCALNAADWKVTGTISGVSGSTITASAWSNANGYADGYFKGGRAVFGTDMRLIVDHVDDTLTLQIPFGSSVASGSSIDAYPGCDGRAETCVEKFNNLLNRLGMDYIASRNPVVWGFK